MSTVQQCAKTHIHNGDPVHDASRQGHSSCLVELIQFPGDCNRVDSALGWPPIHWASYSGQVSCLETLVANGASLFVLDEQHHMTAAHIAAQNGRIDCLKWLLVACHSLANAQDAYGDTPGHKAAVRQHKSCLACLEECGANFEIANLSGETVTDVIRSSMKGTCARSRHRPSPAVEMSDLAMVIQSSSVDDHVDVEFVDADDMSMADQLRSEFQPQQTYGSQVKRSLSSADDLLEPTGSSQPAKRLWRRAQT